MLALAPVLAMVLAAPPCGLPGAPAGRLPFAPGEILSYDLDVMGIVKAGTLSLHVEPSLQRGAVLPLRARVRNTSVFAKIRKVRGYALSYLDTRTLRPQRYRDEGDENGVRKVTEVHGLGKPGPVTMLRSIGEAREAVSFEPTAPFLDVLSTLYALRAARLVPGERVCLEAVGNRRFWRLSGAFAPGTERVETAAGIFDAERFDAELQRVDGGPKRQLHLWFSKDARRLPVAVVSEVELGPVRAMLAGVAGPGVRRP